MNNERDEGLKTLKSDTARCLPTRVYQLEIILLISVRAVYFSRVPPIVPGGEIELLSEDERRDRVEPVNREAPKIYPTNEFFLNSIIS